MHAALCRGAAGIRESAASGAHPPQQGGPSGRGQAVGGCPPRAAYLHMAFLVGDHAEARQLGSRARRGVDGDVVRQHVVDLVHAFVLVDRPAVGQQDADALAAVVRGTAADGDEPVAAVGLVLGHAFGHVLVGRVRHGLVVDAVRNVVAVQNVRDDLEDAGLHDALVGDDQRLGDMVGMYIVRDAVAGADADQGNARLRCGILVEPLHIGLGQRMVLRRRIPVVELNPVYAEGLQAWKDRRAFDGRDPFTDRELHGLSRSRRQEP